MPVVVILAIGTMLVLAARLQQPWGKTPLQAAFSTTLFGLLFVIAGSIGYTIKKSNWFIVTGSWSEDVVWWEVRLGLVLLGFAVFFWRKSLQVLREVH